MGTVVLLALAAVPAWWATEEVERGNQLFLVAFAALMFTLAVWRGISTARTARSAKGGATE